MKLEDYFLFLSPDDIRIRGHRIGIDNVLDYHLQGYTPEQILEHFPSLNLEKIHATLTYYYNNKAETDAYLKRIQQWKETHYQEALLNPSPMRQKIQQIIKERQAIKS